MAFWPRKPPPFSFPGLPLHISPDRAERGLKAGFLAHSTPALPRGDQSQMKGAPPSPPPSDRAAGRSL